VAQNSELFQRAIDTGEPYTLRKRYVRPDGSLIWTEVMVARLGGPAQGVLSIAVDLTDRMRAEEHQTLLVNELNHRVKNTLTLVQSLAAMTKRHSDSPEQFYDAFSARLRALSTTHNLLTEGLWESASLADMLAGELQPYESDRSQAELRGEPIKLRPHHAISLGMVFHELAANAAKYGALSTPKGRVAVSWNVTANGGAPRLTLEWHEHGGPAVAAPTHKGFGSRLIDETARGMHGSAEFDFSPEGLRCTISVPLET
jgi:two-component sensor histidine kinase